MYICIYVYVYIYIYIYIHTHVYTARPVKSSSMPCPLDNKSGSITPKDAKPAQQPACFPTSCKTKGSIACLVGVGFEHGTRGSFLHGDPLDAGRTRELQLPMARTTRRWNSVPQGHPSAWALAIGGSSVRARGLFASQVSNLGPGSQLTTAPRVSEYGCRLLHRFVCVYGVYWNR